VRAIGARGARSRSPAIGMPISLKRQEAEFPDIDAAINGRTGLPAPIVREYSYLQLRVLSELIALGCLTAHGDIRDTQMLRRAS
jgi:hypothetical protein